MTRATIDGNETAVSVAYRLNEVCCIYPITPSSPMAELADDWSSPHRPNVRGTVPTMVEMQSEGWGSEVDCRTGLSIFGDHQDVMAVRQTGFALLSSTSVQEAHDLALIAPAATLRTRGLRGGHQTRCRPRCACARHGLQAGAVRRQGTYEVLQ